jgi:hypothetical protein
VVRAVASAVAEEARRAEVVRGESTTASFSPVG